MTTKYKKIEFYKSKNTLQIDDINVNKILISKKEPCGTKKALKYFIGYNHNDAIRPLCLRLPQMTGYARKFGENITMYFRVNNNNNNKQILKNYSKIWDKTEILISIDFESESVYGNDHEKYIKRKTKIYAGSVITNFHNKKVPKEKTPCKYLSIIILDSVIKANKKYYPQTLLEECKYAQKNINYINDDLEESGSNDETVSDTDNNENDEMAKMTNNLLKVFWY